MRSDWRDDDVKSRREFVAKSVRAAERRLGVPAGWWGTWKHVRSPYGNVEVKFSGGCWTIRHRDKTVSCLISRSFAIKKAVKLAAPKGKSC